MSRAIVKKDITQLPKGAVLEFAGGVFAHGSSTFLPEDIFFDDEHFIVAPMSQTEDDEIGSLTSSFTKSPHRISDLV